MLPACVSPSLFPLPQSLLASGVCRLFWNILPQQSELYVLYVQTPLVVPDESGQDVPKGLTEP